MGIWNRKKSKKLDLLELADVEKYKLMREIKEGLRQRTTEAKLWKAFLEADDVTVNGETIHSNSNPLKGVVVQAEILRSP